MNGTAYIVPSDLLRTSPPKAEWHASAIPSAFTQSLVVVMWNDPNAEREFELRLDVLPLGAPWEPLPLSAVSLLQSFNPLPSQPIAGGAMAPTIVTPPDTVKTALRKLDWPPVRMVR